MLFTRHMQTRETTKKKEYPLGMPKTKIDIIIII